MMIVVFHYLMDSDIGGFPCRLRLRLVRLSPPVTPNVKKLFVNDYKTWWSKTHGNFLDGYLQSLVDAAGSIPRTLLEDTHERDNNVTPKDDVPLNSAKLSERLEGQQGSKNFSLLGPVASISNKRSSQNESDSSREDRCWKKVRPHPDKFGGANVAVIEVPDSPSRTLTALIKEPHGVGTLQRGESQESDGSVSGPDPLKSFTMTKAEKEITSIPRDKAMTSPNPSLRRRPTDAVSVFDGNKVILNYRKIFIFSLWTAIQDKISRSDVDGASSLKDEVQVILEEMDGKDVDISPLRKLLECYFELSTSYDQTRSALHDKDVEATRKELFAAAGERLSNAMFEEHEKVEKLSSIRQSLDEVRGKINKLRKKEKALKVLLDATEKEVEEAKLGALTAEKEFDACYDVDLSNADDSTNLEQKKERLEVMRQDLIHYKLCLD